MADQPNISKASITHLWRWPVKGLGGQSLDEVKLEAGHLLPFDRAFAIENGPSGFATGQPVHIAKRNFICMVHQPATGRMSAAYDEASGLLHITTLDGLTLLVDPAQPDALEALAAELVPEGVRGPLRLCRADDPAGGHGFTDVPDRWISLQNQTSLDEVAEASGAPLDPRRLRANMLLQGWDAFAEEALVGQIIEIGQAKIEIMEPINRCRAIDVNPDSAQLDRNLVRSLVDLRGLRSLGVYARVVEGGTIRTGQRVQAAR